MKIEVGLLKSRVVTDNPKLLKALVQLYSFRVPGSEFSPQFKRRVWDGKKKFLTGAGYFKTGLLDRILEDLKKIECSPTLEYAFKGDPHKYTNIGVDGFDLRPYQIDAVNEALERKRCIIKSPTGSGKTLILAAIITALKGKKMVVMFNTKQLIQDAYNFLTDNDFEDIGINFGDGYIYGDIMLTTVQSIEKILDTHLEEAEVLIVDEVHEFANGETTVAAIESFPKAEFRVGFTATVPTDNIPAFNLEGAFGPVYTVKTVSELVDEGYLTKPIVHMLDLPEVEDSVTEGKSYRDVYDELIVHNDHRNQEIVNLVNRIAENNDKARILILVSRLEHGRKLCGLLGSRAQYVQGSDDLSTRYATIGSFTASNSTSVLVGTRILQTGVDICEITHFINARGLKSPIATIQALGRALRLHDTKSVVRAYDFLDQGKYLHAHARKRLNTYKKEGHEVCVPEKKSN